VRGPGGEVVAPEYPEAVAFRMLGERHIAGYSETMLGRAIFGVLRLMGPKRRLSRTRQNFRAGNTTRRSASPTWGPPEGDMWLNERGMLRHFKHGIVLGSALSAGETNTKWSCATMMTRASLSVSPGRNRSPDAL
jgi:uncharacterized protein (TIGR02265 family)